MDVWPPLEIEPPGWLAAFPLDSLPVRTVEDRVRLAVALSRENVERGTGGPFGAAIFEIGTGALLAVGLNSVVRLGNSVLHAETVAIMAAQKRLGSRTLRPVSGEGREIVSSCEPCAMCLGAVLWSGARRLVFAATSDDARAAGFEEGPVFPESHAYLAERGVEIAGGILRGEAAAVLEAYRRRGGPIYNG